MEEDEGLKFGSRSFVSRCLRARSMLIPGKVIPLTRRGLLMEVFPSKRKEAIVVSGWS